MTARRPLVLVNGQRKQLPTGDTLVGVVQDTDPRLTDAREWTAPTVTQAEAEQGTATTRRAWTAQRVFQAIAAWWAASAAKTKLDGIAAGATANATDAQLRDRATHTGTQAISTVTGLQTALDGKIDTTERGVSGGVATLDEYARIPPSQLPSYVDDVLEYPTREDFPATGEGGKIYIAVNQGTAANPTVWWRWTGTTYVDIPPSPGTTDALVEGSTNLYFSENRVRNTVLTGLSLASSAAVAATDSVLTAFGKLQAQLGLKAPLDSPALTGNPTAPTPASTDNDTSIATTAFVRAAMALFGVGTYGLPSFTGNPNDTWSRPSGTYAGYRAVGAVADGWPLEITGNSDFIISHNQYATGGAAGESVVQRITFLKLNDIRAVRVFERSRINLVVQPWQELWHTGNLVKQTSATDTTAGALMAVGAFGLGASFFSAAAYITDADALTVTGDYPVGATWVGSPFTGTNGINQGSIRHTANFQNTSYAKQEWTSLTLTTPRKMVRNKVAGTWGQWMEIFHTGNFNPATKQDKASIVSTATTRTLALTDAWNYVRPGTTSAITLTVPTNAAVAFDYGTEITIRASGNITLAAASGVTLLAPAGGSLNMTARMTVTLKKVGADVWDVIGQTVAA